MSRLAAVFAWGGDALEARRSIAADLRLDDRAGLARSLGLRDVASDADLVLAAYDRWGSEVTAHLAGDFAFAIWDPARGEVFAARDPFGVRPLFYHATRERLAIAGDVDALLARSDVRAEVDEGTVLDHLLGVYARDSETFFEGIVRLPPGHVLYADPRSVRVARYFAPPERELGFADAEEMRREFRLRFERAVAVRLGGGEPIVAELSGGLDSSSIVCVAHALGTRAEVHLASAVYPGTPTDEARFIDAVARSVSFPSSRYDGLATAMAEDSPFERSHPFRSPLHAADIGRARVAHHAGARVVLSGRGGDELLFERGVYRDLAAHGRWATLLRETKLAPRYSVQTQRFYLRDAFTSLVPRAVRRAYRRVRPNRPAIPSWIAHRLRSKALGGLSRMPIARSWSSETQRATWEWLDHPRLTWGLELETLTLAKDGLSARYPFLDRPLAELVLALPYEHRLPAGRMKRLLRESLADVLPEEIASREHVTTFDAAIRLGIEARLPRLAETILRGPWASEAYVDRGGARALLETRATGDAEFDRLQAVWDIATLEEWLRRLLQA